MNGGIMKHTGDNVFVGRVLGVRDIIGFHGETVTKLTADFHAASTTT